MKLRHPWLITATAWSAAKFVRGWMNTLRCRYEPFGPNYDPQHPQQQGRFLYAFWHEYLLPPIFLFSRCPAQVLISKSADGELLAEVARHLGLEAVRGSTSRGSLEAVRHIVRSEGRYHLGVTPDGPRGPRRQVQPGVIYLASRTGLPIVPVGIAVANAWRLKSWDQFVLPRPWSRATFVTSEAVTVPPEASRGDIEQYRQQLQDALDSAGEVAQGLLEGPYLAPTLRR